MAINFGYFAKESLVSFKRNWVMSLGAIITIYLSLLLVGISVGSSFLLNSVMEGVEQKFSIRIFLNDAAQPSDVTQLQAELAADPRVESVVYYTKEMALEEFTATVLEDSPEIVESLDRNPLPASININLKNPREDVLSMVDTIKANALFPKVMETPNNAEKSLQYGQQVVKQMLMVTSLIRNVSIVFILLLGFISLIFISNAIRIAIYARRKEIGIMRLVGASNWFIRTPFLLEGVLQALIGAILSIGTLALIWIYALPKVRELLPFLKGLEVSGLESVQVSAILVLTGIIVGLAGSGLALRRYLKV